MKITQEVRDYAAQHGLGDEQAVARGMEEKSREFVQMGAEVYSKR
jgi:phosphomethylpyrimidine synthase